MSEPLQCGGALVEEYEAMRELAVRPAEGSTPRAPGVALFLGRGMSSWVKACEACAPMAPEPEMTVCPQEGDTTLLPRGLRSDIAAVLADMVLSNKKEAAS
ncbi:MAG: hypothetical protein M9894_39260 [Planctomycetes bacterium]|nr:hypothetical protein [Planctomycetota bacterium]